MEKYWKSVISKFCFLKKRGKKNCIIIVRFFVYFATLCSFEQNQKMWFYEKPFWIALLWLTDHITWSIKSYVTWQIRWSHPRLSFCICFCRGSSGSVDITSVICCVSSRDQMTKRSCESADRRPSPYVITLPNLIVTGSMKV